MTATNHDNDGHSNDVKVNYTELTAILYAVTLLALGLLTLLFLSFYVFIST